MEAWIKGMLEHIKNDNRFVAWDVINEPIADGSNEWRGINNVFGGTDGDGNPDTEPVEDPENGLLLNWADNHFTGDTILVKDMPPKLSNWHANMPRPI